MKRTLAFVALAGSGVLFLWRIDSSLEAQADAAVAGPLAPFPSERGPENPDASFDPRGEARMTRFDASGSRAYEVKTPNLTYDGDEEGLMRMTELVARVDNPATGNLRAEIKATEGRMFIEGANVRLGSSEHPEIANDTVFLTDVVVTVFEGAPVLPLTIRVPSLTGDLRESRFTSKDNAEAVGPGFEAYGVGLTLDLALGMLRFDEQGRVELVREDDQTARLEAGGSLLVRRAVGDAKLDFEATDEAKLWLEGERPVFLGGKTLAITAVESGSEGSFVLRSARADGRAQIDLPDGQFRADRATFEAAADGGRTARLDGSPSAQLTLTRPDYDPSVAGTAPLVEVRLAGRGPMTIEELRPIHFELLGPAEARWEDDVLSAAGGLRGLLGESREEATLSAWDLVELNAERGNVLTDDLNLEVAVLGDGTHVEATATGSSTLRGTTTEGEAFELTAAEQLVARQGPSGWSVPLASGVEVRLTDQDVTASADILREFRGDTWTYQAEGRVRARDGERSARGERLVSYGRDHAVLFAGAAPARVEWTDGEARARRIELRPDKLKASEQVIASLREPGWLGEVDAQSLDVERTRSDRADGAEESSLHLRAAGKARLTVTTLAPARSQTLTAELFVGHYNEWLDADAQVLGGSLSFQADGAVDARTELDGSLQTLAADSVYFESEFGDLRRVGPWSIVARGGVQLDRGGGEGSGGGLMGTGSGDVLRISSTGEARLEALDGRTVETTGRLPGGKFPFSLSGPWIEFSADKVRAANFVLRIADLVLLPGSDPADDLDLIDRRSNTDVLVTADELSGSPNVLFFQGRVHLESVDVADTTWSVDAEFLQVGNPELAAANPSAPPRSFEAWGGVDITYGPMLRALGNRLRGTLASGRVRIEGTPAILELPGGVTLETDSVEYDVRAGLPVKMERFEATVLGESGR